MNATKAVAHWGLLMLAVTSIQCAGARKSGAPDWGSAETGFRLHYRFVKGATQHYQLQLKTKSTQEVMGNEQVQEFTITSYLSQQPLAQTAEDQFRLRVTYDSLNVDAPGAAGAMLQQGMKNIIGKSLTLVVTPLGKIMAVEGAEKFPNLPGNQTAAGMMRNFFLRLPDHPVKPGESWLVPPEDLKINSTAADMTVHTDTTRMVLQAVTTFGGTDVVKLALRSKFTLVGSGEQGGATYDLNGSGESSGVAYFDYKRGVLLQSDVQVTSEGVAEITSPQALTVDWRNTQNVSLKLLK